MMPTLKRNIHECTIKTLFYNPLLSKWICCQCNKYYTRKEYKVIRDKNKNSIIENGK